MVTSKDDPRFLRREEAEKLAARFSDLLARYSIKGKGKAIFNQGQTITGIYFICEGLVKLTSVTEAGKETVLDIIAPCSVVGEIYRMGGATHSYSAITLEDLTTLALLKIEDLPLILRSDPSAGLTLAQHLCVRLRIAYGTISWLQLPLDKRMLKLLARLMLLREGRHQKGLIKIPFALRELAQLMQTTPETLSRTLRSLEGKGIIRKEKKGLRVLQEEMLRKYVDETN